MYAHEVIADYEKFDLAGLVEGGYFWNKLTDKINRAVKFHVGNAANVETIDISKEEIFQGENGEVKLPFDLCWFDWHRYGLPTNCKEPPPGGYSFKRGVLCQALFDTVLMCYIFQHSEELNRWAPSPVATLHFIDSCLSTNLHSDSIYEILEKKECIINPKERHCFSDVIWFPIPISNYHGFIKTDLVDAVGFYENIILNKILKLLSCKNVTTEKVHPAEKLNKKRKKSGKLPLFSYHTLVLKPTTQQEKSAPKHLWDNRIHLCRGHFKTYTEANKLFGKHTGRYWWQPCVRGNKNNGVVMKDYLIAQERNPKCTKN